jgi:Tfp pilus assembly protein PilO
MNNKSSSIVLFLLAVGLFYTFTSPQYGDAQELRALASEYRDVIDNVSRIAEMRDGLLTNYEAIPQDEKDRLVKVLPESVDVVGFAQDLDSIASQYGIAVESVQVGGGTTQNTANVVLPEFGQSYEKTDVSFTFVSNYPNFMSFLTDLEQSLRIMDVKEVSFRAEETGLYEHQVTVETYWLK